jgi:hypothetical protein
VILTTTPVAKVAAAFGGEPKAETEADPLFVKLRAEAQQSLLSSGKGQLHLGFHMDPIHHVHWNNLAAPMTYEIIVPEGAEFSAAKGEAPKVEEAEADMDPREFLINIDFGGKRPEEPLKLRIQYFACDDGDQFCKAITQDYEIAWKVDRDAGRVQDRSGGKGRPSGGGGPGRGMDPDQMLSRMDSDGDKKISKNEARGPMQQRFDQMDADSDGFISAEEMKSAMERMRGERRQRPPQK